MNIMNRFARNKIVQEIKSAPVEKQIDILSDSLTSNHLKPSLLRTTLEKNAPIEMRKGIEKLIKGGKTPTVDLLLEEYRASKSFQKLARSVGLDESWFIKLAEDELASQRLRPLLDLEERCWKNVVEKYKSK
jgi:hypothetical protein